MAVNRRTFRIFISSTFSDFRAERDALHDRVFPDLRQLCAQHGARFRAIDLRWGVNESASLDQHTMRICLEEIARCQRLSPKPNFLVLLGDRYGWQQLPDAIPADEFKAVQAQVASTDGATGVTLLDRWYRCDDNAVPPEYILQPRTGEAASNYAVWEAEERKLRKILRNAVEKLELPEVRRAKYLLSATGQEILHGALDPMLTDAKEHVFGFFRSIDELPNGHSAVDARDYLDLVDGQPDKGAHTRLDDLKARLRARLPANITEYKARWTESRITTDHLDAFCEDVRTQLTQVIEAQLANIEEIAPLAQEIADHTAFAKELADSFTGRNQALRELSEYLTTVAAEQSPTVVHAPSGAGKSAFMAEVARQARLAHPTAVIVQRFIGATPSSSNPITLLRQILAQITEAYGDSAVSVPTERKELLESIPSLLGQATPEQPLLIVLDALDQLQVSWDFTLADWLPTELPAHVHLVVSTTQSDTLQELKHCAPNAHYHALADLSLEDGKQILDTWLASVDRCLTDGQKQQVLDGFAHIGQLLYLQLAFERARHWRSYDAPKNLAGDVRGLVRMLIAELSLENNHGKLLVDRVLDCLAAARHGLTEDELLDVLSRDEEVLNDFRRRAHKAPVTNELPVVVWSRLYGDLSPYLVERDADGAKVLAFFNKQFMELAVEESLQAEKIPLRAAALADYFASQPNFLDAECNRPNARKLAELPYHLIRAERWQQLEDTLMHFDFCMAKCQLNESDDLVGYFRDALQAIPDSSDEFRLWESFMSERMHILRRGDERWPAHKILLQLAIEHADDSPVTKAAEIWLENGNCNWVWMKNNLRIKHASASPCIGILEGHACPLGIQGAIEHSNGNIISWSMTEVILWDRNGMRINNIETETSCGGVDGVTELLNTNLLLSDGFSTRQKRRDYSLLLLDGDGKYIDKKTNLHTWIQVFFDASYATDVSTFIDGSCSLYEDKKKLAVFDYSEMAESKIILRDGSVISWTNSNDITYKQKKSFNKKVFKGHTDKVLGVNQLSENTIISWSMDGFIRFWDLLEKGEGENGFFFKINKSWERAVLEATGGYELHRSYNGRFAVYDDHGEVIIEQNQCDENEPINSKHKLDLGRGKYAIWSSKSDAISITDTDKKITKIFRGHLGQIRGLIKLSNNRMLSFSRDLTLRLWNVDGNTSENIDKRGGHGGLGGVKIKRIADDIYASFANESDLDIVFGSTDTNFAIKLWRSNGELVSILNGHTDFIIDLILLKGDRFLSYSKDATLKLWSHDGKLLKTMVGHKVKIDSVQVTESNLIVSISCDGIIIIWDDSGEILRTLQTGEEKDECDDYSKKTFILLKGQKLLSWGYTNNSLYLWDINTGVIISELKEHAEPVCDPIVLSGGNFITYPKNNFNEIAPENNILYLWDNNGDLVFRFTGHSARIAGVTELEGHTLASWSDDYTVRIWNMATGNLDQLITNPLLDQLRGISGFYQLSQNRIIVTDKTMVNYDKNKHDAFILDASGDFINSLYSTDKENRFYQNIFVLNGDGFLLRLHGEVIRFDADGNIQDKCLWDDVKYYHPEWLSTIAPDKTLKGESFFLSSNGNIFSVSSLYRRPFECIYWHGDSDISAYYMEDDGTTIIGLESRHVFSIKMYLGNVRVSLSDLVPDRGSANPSPLGDG